jgi:acyl transferase domain-containing protein
VRNLRQPVRFTEAVSELAARGPCVLVEIGPHSVLGGSIRATLRAAGIDDALVVSTGARGTPERVSLLAALGTLYCKGFNLDPARMLSQGVD